MKYVFLNLCREPFYHLAKIQNVAHYKLTFAYILMNEEYKWI